jgi:hypothetical protein
MLPGAGGFTASLLPRPSWLLALVLLLPAALRAASPDPPAEAVLARALAVTLPAAWRLVEARLEAQADLGSPAAPEIRSRLAATLALAMPAYEPAGTEGAVTLVRPVAPEGHARRVQVHAVSTSRDGGWETRLTVEPPEALEPPGIPAAAIPGRLIELGSEAERQWRAAREAEAEVHQAKALADQRRAGALQAAAAEAMALAEQRRAAALAAATAEARRAEAARDAEALRQEAAAEALAAARRAAAARALPDQADRSEAMRALAEAERLAEARRAAAEALEAAALREATARTAAQRVAIEERTRQLAELRARFAGDRNARLAALDQAMRSEDPVIRALGFEAALTSQDAAAISLALRLTLLQKRELQVVTFAPSIIGPGQTDAQEVAASVAGFTLLLRDINPTTGKFAGTARLGGSEALVSGALGRSEMTVALRPLDKGVPLLVGGVAQQGCSLMLRLSEVQTLDGIFTCTAKETPRLVARVALD